MRALTLLAIAILPAAACHVGPDVANYPPANSPYGVTGSFVVGKATVEGELLAVGDSTFVLLRDHQVLELPFAAISSARFPQVHIRIDGEAQPSYELLARLRMVSRFPQGLSAELERKLLEAYGQTAPTVLGK